MGSFLELDYCHLLTLCLRKSVILYFRWKVIVLCWLQFSTCCIYSCLWNRNWIPCSTFALNKMFWRWNYTYWSYVLIRIFYGLLHCCCCAEFDSFPMASMDSDHLWLPQFNHFYCCEHPWWYQKPTCSKEVYNLGNHWSCAIIFHANLQAIFLRNFWRK